MLTTALLLPVVREAGTRVAAAMRFCLLIPIDRAPGMLAAADHETPASFVVTTMVDDPLVVSGLTIVAELTGITCRIDFVADDATEVVVAIEVRIIDSGIRDPVDDDVVDVIVRMSGRTTGTFFFVSVALLAIVNSKAAKSRELNKLTQKNHPKNNW